MARKAAKPKPKPPPAAPRWRFPTRAGVAATVCVLTVAGVVGVGLSAATAIEYRERFTLPLSALDFDVPPWIERDAFLAEVRYLSDLPDTFNSYNPAATERLRSALAKHPSVESVQGGYTTIDRRYVLTVVFREPVLRVTTIVDGTPSPRMVDARGVLLPVGKMDDNLPELSGVVGDAVELKRAAELARQFRPKSVARANGGWRITEKSGRVLVVGW